MQSSLLLRLTFLQIQGLIEFEGVEIHLFNILYDRGS